MLENLSSSRGNRSSKLDNASCIGSSYNTQKGKAAKQMNNRTTKLSTQKERYKNENRC